MRLNREINAGVGNPRARFRRPTIEEVDKWEIVIKFAAIKVK
jgi:hypothetical protein